MSIQGTRPGLCKRGKVKSKEVLIIFYDLYNFIGHDNDHKNNLHKLETLKIKTMSIVMVLQHAYRILKMTSLNDSDQSRVCIKYVISNKTLNTLKI